MKPMIVFLLILSLLVPFALSSAQNPPLDSPEDNACHPGGAMEGKCSIEWHWVCGWYLARWQANGGWFTPNNLFNDDCISLLPPRPVAAPNSATSNVVITLCGVSGVFGNNTLCVSSDQTGTADFGTDGSIDRLFLFTNATVPASCLPTYNGRPLIGLFGTASFNPPFTDTELFITLGLGANYCAYG
jgi:hypothetical protein